MKCRKGIDQPAKAKTGGQHHECEPKHHAANMRNSAEKAKIRGRGSQQHRGALLRPRRVEGPKTESMEKTTKLAY